MFQLIKNHKQIGLYIEEMTESMFSHSIHDNKLSQAELPFQESQKVSKFN